MAKLWSDFPSDRLQSDDFVGHSNNEDAASKSIQTKNFFLQANIKSTLSATATATPTIGHTYAVGPPVGVDEWSLGIPYNIDTETFEWSLGTPFIFTKLAEAEETLKTISATATGTAQVSRLADRHKTFSTTATGTALLSRLKDIHKTFSATSTGTATIDKAITNGAFPVTATCTAGISKFRNRPKSLSTTATGTGGITKLKVKLKSFSTTATGTALLSRLKSLRKSFSPTATGTAGISRLKALHKIFAVTATVTAALSRLKKFYKIFTATATGTPLLSRRKALHKIFSVIATVIPDITVGGATRIEEELKYFIRKKHSLTPSLRYIEKVKKGPNAKILQYIEKTTHLHTPPITLAYEVYNLPIGGTVYGARFNRMMFNRPRRETGTHTFTFHYNTQYYVRAIPSPQTHGLTYLVKKVHTNGIGLAYGIKYLAVVSGFTDLLKYYVKKVHTQGYGLTYIPKHTPTPSYKTLAYYIKKVHDIYDNLRYILKRTPAAQTYGLTYIIKTIPAAKTYGLDYDVRLVRTYPLMLSQYYTKSIQKYSPLYPEIGVRLKYLLPNFDIITLTRDLRYILKVVKSQQYTLAYWVKTIHTSSTIGAAYYVRQIKSKVADIRYIIKTIPEAKTYPLTYYVHRRTTNTSIGLAYLLPTGFSQYVKRYLARYIIIIHLIKQRDLRYIIKRTPAPSTKGLAYYVRKSHIKSPAPTSQYYVLKKHLISPLLRYIVPQLKKKVYQILTYFVKSEKKVTPLPGLQYLTRYSRKYRYPPGILLRYMILGETVFSEVCTHLNCPLPTPKTEYLTCGLTTNKSVSVTCPLQVPKSVTITCRFICGV